jgi:cbb3-type cytochrome oxidase subunit 3
MKNFKILLLIIQSGVIFFINYPKNKTVDTACALIIACTVFLVLYINIIFSKDGK